MMTNPCFTGDGSYWLTVSVYGCCVYCGATDPAVSGNSWRRIVARFAMEMQA
jgi:hypothetical protein